VSGIAATPTQAVFPVTTSLDTVKDPETEQFTFVAFADGELPKDITATRSNNETALLTLFIAVNIALSPKSTTERADLLKRHSGSLPSKG
jgi:hypothetical protein